MRHDLIAGLRLASAAATILVVAALSNWIDGAPHAASAGAAPAAVAVQSR
ncbi:MAG TPA: hypothetical protein VHW05_08600 [Phenylobacterium sp.]|jgi:hypothetical protein|nr:hypothetical protein [Phenylobacterium sp.]